MDGLRHPVGEKPAGVYWVRRLIVFGVIGLVLVVAWFLIFSPGGDGDGEGAGTTTEPPVTTSPTADATGSEGAAFACTDADVVLTATPNPFTSGAGSLPQFDVSVEHVSLSPCLLSTSAEGTELYIWSGRTDSPDRVFSSLDCADDGSFTDTELLLADGATEMFQVNWTRQRSSEGCATPTSTPGDGFYWAEITVQGIAAEPVQFELAS